MESGTYASLGVTYTAGDSFWLVRSGSTVTYYKGATLAAAMTAGALRTVTGVTSTLYFDSSIYSAGASLDVGFTPQPAGAIADSADRSRTTYVYSSHGELLSKYVDGTAITEVYAYDGLSRITSTSDFGDSVNEFTNQNAASFWGVSNATPSNTTINGIYAMTVSSSAAGLASASAIYQQPAVVAGDTLSFTITLKAGSVTSAAFRLLGGTSGVGDNADSSAVLLSGPGTLARRGGSDFQVTGLSNSTETVVRVTRTFKQSEVTLAQIFVNASPAGCAGSGESIMLSNPILTRATQSLTYSDTSSGSTTTLRFANGLVQTSTYDKAGDLLTYAESGTGITTATAGYLYDALGRLRVVTNPTGQSNYLFYDGDGRKVADIDSNGSVTEYRYDAAGNLTSSTAYANKLTGTQMSSLISGGAPSSVTYDSIRPAADSTNDRWSWNVYDQASRLLQTIDGTGSTTVYAYDGASELVSTTQYAGLISSANLAALKTAATAPNLWPHPDDASYWTILYATPSSAGTIDGANAFLLTSTSSTAVGAVVMSGAVSVVAGDSVTYSLWILGGTSVGTLFGLSGSVSGWGAGEDSMLTILSGPGTAVEDVGGRWQVTNLSTTVPTHLSVTRIFRQSEPRRSARFDRDHSPSRRYHHHRETDRDQVGDAAYLPSTADTTNDRVSRLFYDNAGRLVGTLDAEGYLSQTVYDAAGRKIRTIAYSGATGTTYRASGSFADLLGSVTPDANNDVYNWWLYDARGMLRISIDPEGYVSRYDYTPAGYLSQQAVGHKLNASTLIATPADACRLPGSRFEPGHLGHRLDARCLGQCAERDDDADRQHHHDHDLQL